MLMFEWYLIKHQTKLSKIHVSILPYNKNYGEAEFNWRPKMLDHVKKIFETRLKKERLQFSANFANNNSKFTYYIYNYTIVDYD